MVEDSRKTAGARSLRPLNQPLPVSVEASPEGEPRTVLWRGRSRQVTVVHDSWRIDDEWWRDPISRCYFAVECDDGRQLTVFCDLERDQWFAQPYDGPRRERG
ncbi:MAG: DUF6504 family protein [Dehalococcoidia bacterium]